MIHKYQLKNGLKVILVQSHKSPVVSVQMWVRTGSADEAKGEEGISHFIEHLVFKGTEKFKVGEIASQIEGSGGELNAYTSFDQTVFYVTISKQFESVALDSISQMMGSPLFDPQEIDNEREVVVEEIKRGQDSLGRRASQLLFSSAYKGHPYGIPVIGYEKNVRSWSKKKIKDYFESRYVPRNMFLVVTGDFEKESMKKKVDSYFLPFRDLRVKRKKRKSVPKWPQGKVAVEKTEFEQSILYFSWPAPKIGHKDVAALEVMSLILGQGESSRLVQRLRIQEPLVNSIGAGVFSPQQAGLVMISSGLNHDKLAPTLQAISKTVADFLKYGVSEAELQKAKINLESDKYYSAETVDGWARQVGEAEFLVGNPKAFEAHNKAIRKVTPRDVLRLAKKYLNPKLALVTYVTNGSKEEAEKILKQSMKKFAQNSVTIVSTKDKGDRSLKLSGKKQKIKETGLQIKEWFGIRVLLYPIESTHTVAARAVMFGGTRAEEQGEAGLTELLGKTWLSGTHRRNEFQLSAEIERLAAGISPLTGRNSVGIGAEGLSFFEPQLADLFFDCLVNSTIPAEVVEREKIIQIEQIKSKKDNPAQICMRNFSRLLYPSHPYGSDMLGESEAVKGFTQLRVRDLLKKHLRRGNLTLVVSGAFNESIWKEALESVFESIPDGPKGKINHVYQPPTSSQKAFEISKKEQSHLVLGFSGLKMNDPDRYALHIIQSILAGQGGRLFLELRDKNSLAYSVAPLRTEGIERGSFGAYIGCSPEKTEKALSMMREEFRKLIEVKVPHEELERAQRYLVGRHDIDLQRTSAIASSIIYEDIYDLDPFETFNIGEKYFSVTEKDVQRVAERIFTQPEIISMVGPIDIKES
ncbi:MAG: insulinase family protein [Proteobacteria bacterium]|jgi:zinc protease|nr:insulinase family protein [Pseudomonadota bacterium]